MIKGLLIQCPKCCGREFSIEFNEQKLISRLNNGGYELRTSNNLLINKCDKCGYMEFTLPMDAE